MYMSIGEAARFLGVSVVTLRRWHGNGKLTPRWRTPGGHRRYGVDDLNDTADVKQSSRRVVWCPCINFRLNESRTGLISPA